MNLKNQIKMFIAASMLTSALTGTAYAQSNGFGNGTPSNLTVSADGKITGKTLTPSSATSEITGEMKSKMPIISPEDFPLIQPSAPKSSTGIPGSAAGPEIEKNAAGSATEQWPYTTRRVAIVGIPGPGRNLSLHNPTTSVPYRQTGKLLMRFGSSWFVCTASLIKRGVLVSAAHCVHNYGTGISGLADEVRWYPANVSNSFTTSGGPWGYFPITQIYVPTTYFNGNDTCSASAPGIVCNNDVAVLAVTPRNGTQVGAILGGWYNYGWNNYSFFTSPALGNNTIGSIHQLGYPLAFDGGYQMQRTTSLAKYIQTTGSNSQPLKNYQLGSAQTGGSSGGPWLVNFGANPIISSGASAGSQNQTNTVVATTSWGYGSSGLNVMGASFFGQNFEFPNADYGGYGAGNIGALVQAVCAAYPANC